MAAPPEDNSSRLQELKEEIDAKKRFISTLPPFCRSHGGSESDLFRANHIKILAEKQEEYDVIVEEQRVASVQREHLEVHPLPGEECPICLEMQPFTIAFRFARFSCCGNGVCQSCAEETCAGGVLKIKTCPLCRSEDFFIAKGDSKESDTEKFAKKGRAWAQTSLGLSYWLGSRGFRKDKKKSMKWLELAAEQGFPIALAHLAGIYGEGKLVNEDPEMARSLYKKAADLGNALAQYKVGFQSAKGYGGEVDMQASVYYFTLAYGNQYEDDNRADVAYFLGCWYRDGKGGLDKSMMLAKHYLTVAAKGGYESAYPALSLVLADLRGCQYGGVKDLSHGGVLLTFPGHNPLPKSVYWARKGMKSKDPGIAHESVKAAKFIDSNLQRSKICHNCGKCATSAAFKCCVRCKSAWYCSKDCQAKSWKTGHKLDCVKQE